MIYDRRHTRQIADFGGLAAVMPLFATALLIASLSSLGLPGLNGFVGEFLILLGSFTSPFLSRWFSVAAASGVIFAAVYLLWMYQRVVFGRLNNPANRELKDLTAREIAVLIPVLVFIVWIGVYPGTFLRTSSATATQIVATVRAHAGGQTSTAK
jgi:NADH-quinone oxidoreductase subunit M